MAFMMCVCVGGWVGGWEAVHLRPAYVGGYGVKCGAYGVKYVYVCMYSGTSLIWTPKLQAPRSSGQLHRNNLQLLSVGATRMHMRIDSRSWQDREAEMTTTSKPGRKRKVINLENKLAIIEELKKGMSQRYVSDLYEDTAKCTIQ